MPNRELLVVVRRAVRIEKPLVVQTSAQVPHTEVPETPGVIREAVVGIRQRYRPIAPQIPQD